MMILIHNPKKAKGKKNCCEFARKMFKDFPRLSSVKIDCNGVKKKAFDKLMKLDMLFSMNPRIKIKVITTYEYIIFEKKD